MSHWVAISGGRANVVAMVTIWEGSAGDIRWRT
jgi:hypothetical protein